MDHALQYVGFVLLLWKGLENGDHKIVSDYLLNIQELLMNVFTFCH